MMLGLSAVRTVEIAVRFVPHMLALVVVTSTLYHLPHPFGPVGWLFLTAPILESVLGEQRSRRTPSHAERIACQLAPWLWLPLQAAVLVAGISIVRDAPDPVAAAWLAIPAGMLSGMFGLAAAHELMHRRERIAQSAAALLLVSCGYGHFLVEHVRGHHRRVGTLADPATARLGESVYAFLPRTLKGGLVSAWRLEAERLARSGRRVFDPRNRLIALGALSILLCAAAWLAAGLAGAVFFVVQGAVSAAILEVTNYIQHYGIVRREAVRGVRNPIAAVHAWDCAFRLTNLLLIDLGRHSDHHLRPARGADMLELRRDAPRLPAGYFTLFVLALLPPLWMQIINPRVMLVRKRIDRGLTPLPAKPTEEGEFRERKD
jgi:alkane 1-monooxygenase